MQMFFHQALRPSERGMKSARGFRIGWPLRVLVLGILLAATLSRTHGQQTVNSASLSGYVEDAQGAAVSGATLIVTNLETNRKQIATADSAGRYKFPFIQVGPYQLSIAATGFSTVTKAVDDDSGPRFRSDYQTRNRGGLRAE